MIARIFAVFLLSLASSPAAEWQALFNGRDLDGWRVECRDPDRAKTYWRAVDGSIECDTRGDRKHDYVWLLSEREFGDFEFECLVQTFAGSSGNSGIQIRSRFLPHEKKGHWLHGPQIDIHPPGPWRCGMIYDETWETRRWIFPPLPSSKAIPEWGPEQWRWVHADAAAPGSAAVDPAKPGWNRLRIVARGPFVGVDVNGIPVTRFDGTGILDDDAHRRHQAGLRGHFALQLHANNDLHIRFRDLRIRELEAPSASTKVTVVDSDAELRSALGKLGPGSTIRIAPGRYRPGLAVRDVHGTPEQPVIIEGLDPRDPPLFEGGKQAFHFSEVSHLSLRWLHARGQSHNGINIDDGGSLDTPSHHIELAHIKVEDTGPKGNFDGIKCSGVDHLLIRDSQVSGWGGQAIDFVGCHHAEIARCKFLGKPGFSQTTGPQFKGGSSEVRIHHCEFKNAGQRPIQAGGSTGLDYFRPPEARFEAARINIEDNLIIGGQCAVGFTGVDECQFIHNTIIRPEKWIFRILQESTQPRFVRCGNVEFSRNLIVFDRSRIRTDVNIGPNTRPETFRFDANHWFAADQADRSRPGLPTEEADGVYGIDPGLDPKTRQPKTKLPAGRR